MNTTENHSAEKDRVCIHPNHGANNHTCGPFLSCNDPGCPCASKTENAVTYTEVNEWAVQCRTRGGDLHTGRPFTTEREAISSGDRLAQINGSDWWLVSRLRIVTVETCPWREAERTLRPGEKR